MIRRLATRFYELHLLDLVGFKPELTGVCRHTRSATARAAILQLRRGWCSQSRCRRTAPAQLDPARITYAKAAAPLAAQCR